jgi:hypothetical protein
VRSHVVGSPPAELLVNLIKRFNKFKDKTEVRLILHLLANSTGNSARMQDKSGLFSKFFRRANWCYSKLHRMRLITRWLGDKGGKPTGKFIFVKISRTAAAMEGVRLQKQTLTIAYHRLFHVLRLKNPAVSEA